ncbi:deoxyribose-phosphate aldolase [Pustulibacterium marinum]|uniref:Deoxyribose-phosphate aldolase n=1 Tax=Pustulibacterium marinum TaxID=1224947 RepID=A0A1I7ILF7_9FLAO|nr:deoxyribose-phosphate aldolase [Pustulibacterium marinum]SFU73752.1 deoxyribose-phosphate aldolase [Pustulibacterium marinum]
MNLSKYIDHTLLKAVATPQDIAQLCDEAIKYQFASVCVNSCYVTEAFQHVKNSDVKVCSVIGFPLGAMSTEAKVFEAQQAVKDGATEIDMVINVGKLKAKDFEYIATEIAAIKKAVGDLVLKVIIETCYLTDEEKTIASELSVKAKADFVKTSTGFGTGGATLEDIAIMKAAVNRNAKLKASGGIRDFETAKAYVEAGADRLGTSNGIAIIEGKTGEGY